ncbi:MAG: cation:proton antiporter [Labilithrix sp.]|nr:cation:proton antiporter [Labilithrix sp.]
MESAHAFLATLAIVLGVAAITTIVFQRLRQPVVLGYIIAGLLVGPHVPLPIHADPQTVHTLSELGVILLMFAIGLELNVDKLVRVAPTAGVIAVLQVALMMAAGFAVGRAFDWTVQESIYAGGAIAISSTTIIAKVFDEMKVEARLREIVYGVLIIEDILAILLLATMSTISSGKGLDAMTLATTTGKLLAFLVGMVVIGLLVVPRLMRWVVRLDRPETTLVASVGICFGLASACAAFHYSVALGAFVAGVLISESGEGHTVEHLLIPVRDMFAAIFFVSVGMLIDPKLVAENWLAVVVLSVVVIVGKILGVALGGVVSGCGLRTSVRAGMSLSQIGEFSFIIVGLGLQLGATRPFLYPVAVAVSAITTLTTPALVRRSDATALAIERRLPRNVVSFITLYSAWLERVRAAPTSSTTSARVRRQVLLLLLDAGAIVGLLLGGALLHKRAEEALATRFGVGEVVSQAIFVGGAALIGLPFLLGVVRLTRAIGLSVVGLGQTKKKSEPATSGSIAIAVQLGLLTAVGAACIVVVEPFVPAGVGALLLTALVAAAIFAFWRNAKQFDVEVQAGGAVVVAVLRSKLRPHDDDGEEHDEVAERAAVESELADDVAAFLPGLGAPKLFRVEAESSVAGRTLGEIDLRSKTGAAVLALVRDGKAIMLPDTSERLDVGVIVATVGSDEALASAKALLCAAEGAARAT